jgi:transcriptional regulator with XRE-family HTH domain
MDIGNAIKKFRDDKKISQNKLSKLAELNRGYVYKLENNQINPSLSTLERIAKALNTKVYELIKYAETEE